MILETLSEPANLVRSEWNGIQFDAPILVDIQQPITSIFYVIYIIEMIQLIISTIFMTWFIMLLYSFQMFHHNLKIMLIYHYVVYLLGGISRLYLIMVQLKYITDLSSPIFLITSLLRCEYYSHAICGVPGIVVERFFATVYVRDYESKKRTWITVVCIVYVFLQSQFYAIPVTFFQPPLYYPILFACISIISSKLILNYLYQKNSQILDTSLNGTRKYTLSQKFQLEENLRVMWYLRGLGLMFFLVILFIIIVLVLPWMIFGQESFYGLLIISMFDFSLSTVGIISPIICMFYFYQTNYQPFMMKMNLRNDEIEPERKISSATTDTNVYFEQLQKSWN